MADETISTQIVREAPEIEAYKTGLLQEAQRMYNQGITLPAFEAAGLSGTQRQAIDLAKQSVGVYQPYLQKAEAGVDRGMGMAEQGFSGIESAMGQLPQYMQANLERSLGTLGKAEQIAGEAGAPGQSAIQQGIAALGGAAQGFDPTSTQAFMNPYQQQVIDAAMQQMDIQGQQAQNRAAAQAVGAGAFGGTRQGVQSAVLEGELAREKNAAIANLLASGYQQSQQAAQQAFEQQQARQMQQAAQYGQLGATATGTALQQAQALQGIGGLYGQQALEQARIGQSGVGLGVQGGQAMAGVGTQMAGMGMNMGQLGQAAQGMAQADVSMLSQAGAIEQANRQAQLDAQRQTAYQQATAPMQQLAFVSDIYKGAPSSQMAITSQSSPSASPMQSALGTIAGVGTGIAGASKLF
jgi:hypothetical protein